jgi:HlyD family secretion protein
VEVYIEEGEMSRLKIGQEALILVDGLETGHPRGRITYFGQKAEFSPKYVISEKERKSLLYLVKISADDHAGVLKVGMPVTVMLYTSEDQE